MEGPKAPGIGASVEKWETWAEKYGMYLREIGESAPFAIDKKFDTYKNKQIKGFGTNWANAVKYGDDKKHLKTMEHNWKFFTYVGLKGVEPKTFKLKRY